MQKRETFKQETMERKKHSLLAEVVDSVSAVEELIESLVRVHAYRDEDSWEELDPRRSDKKERDEYERFCKMYVDEHVNREQAENDDIDKVALPQGVS